MNRLIEETLERVASWNKIWPNSVVLFSGGKDSTALLHLLRYKAGIDIPVIQWREPKFNERYAYSDNLVKKWGLEMYDYPPCKVELASGPDTETGEIRFDLLKYHQWSPTSSLVLCLGTERPKPGERYLCAVTDYLNRPTGTFNWKWPACYVGTKNTDTDLMKGQVCLKSHIRMVPNSPVHLYPMRDWTDENIFQYLVDNGVEPDPTRYIMVDGKWVNNPDKSLNSDFYPVCINCVDRHQGPQVDCPKLKCKISNISESVPYNDIEFKDLGFRKTWKDASGKELNEMRHVTG